jgi:hypothetical protein
MSEAFVIIHNRIVFKMRCYSQSIPKAATLPLLGCSWIFVHHICGCLLYLEAFSSIRILRAHHVVVTRDPLDIVIPRINIFYFYHLVKVPHCFISENFRDNFLLYAENRKISDGHPRLCTSFYVVSDVAVPLVAAQVTF